MQKSEDRSPKTEELEAKLRTSDSGLPTSLVSFMNYSTKMSQIIKKARI
jgi:hypothetical protein